MAWHEAGAGVTALCGAAQRVGDQGLVSVSAGIGRYPQVSAGIRRGSQGGAPTESPGGFPFAALSCRLPRLLKVPLSGSTHVGAPAAELDEVRWATIRQERRAALASCGCESFGAVHHLVDDAAQLPEQDEVLVSVTLSERLAATLSARRARPRARRMFGLPRYPRHAVRSFVCGETCCLLVGGYRQGVSGRVTAYPGVSHCSGPLSTFRSHPARLFIGGRSAPLVVACRPNRARSHRGRCGQQTTMVGRDRASAPHSGGCLHYDLAPTAPISRV